MLQEHLHRRQFIRNATALSALVMVPSWAEAASVDSRQIGIQLYTLRSILEQDPAKVLKQLAQQGYKQLEGYRAKQGLFFGFKPKEFQKLCADNGLSVKSWHVSGGWDEQRKGLKDELTMLNRWQELCTQLKEAGASFVVVPYVPETDRADASSMNRLAEQFNEAGEVAKKMGLSFCYHNHAFEFEQKEGVTLFEILLANTNADVVNFELDLYWAVKAGQDPIELFRQHAGRFPLWHVKDMNADTGQFAEVGTGKIDFRSIFNMAETAGLQQFFVEQDKCPGDPLASTAISIKNLKNSILR